MMTVKLFKNILAVVLLLNMLVTVSRFEPSMPFSSPSNALTKENIFQKVDFAFISIREYSNRAVYFISNIY